MSSNRYTVELIQMALSRGYKPAALAAALGVSKETIRKYTRNKATMCPRVGRAMAILLGLSASVVLLELQVDSSSSVAERETWQAILAIIKAHDNQLQQYGNEGIPPSNAGSSSDVAPALQQPSGSAAAQLLRLRRLPPVH